MNLCIGRLLFPGLLTLIALGSQAQIQARDTTEVRPPIGQGQLLPAGKTDTRIGTQISDHSGKPEFWRLENPKIRPYMYSPLPPTDVKPGGTMAEHRTFTRVFFPGIEQDQWSPPDPTLAVGPEHIVVTVNMKIAFYRKDGTLQYLKWLGNQETDGFMASIGALDFTFDPKCYYDAQSGRFFVVVPEKYSNPNRSWLNIAVSDDSDPNGIWYFYRSSSVVTVGGSSYWLDYPGFGVDQNGVYVTGNLFGFSSGFAGAWWRCFDKTPMLSGSATTFVDFRDSDSASVQAAQSDGSPLAAFFVSVANTSTLRVHAVRDLLTAPALVSVQVAVPSFAYPNADAPQPGTSARVDTLDGRIMNVWWRDGRLLAAHAVRPNTSTSRTIARWYEVFTNNWPASGAPFLRQVGSIDDGRWKFFPALALNDFNDMGVIVGASSLSQFAGVYTTGRKFTDPDGETGALTLAKIGSASYTGGRWGDYFGIQVDPTDGLTFWGIGEYVDSASHWKTWITSWRVATYRQLNATAESTQLSPIPLTIQCTADGRGLGAGKAPITRTYYDGDTVSLSAPLVFSHSTGTFYFTKWVVDGVDQPSGQNAIEFGLNQDSNAVAKYTWSRFRLPFPPIIRGGG